MVLSGQEPASGQSILPAHPDSKGGGNPLQGLGRPDDPYPSRYADFAPKNEAAEDIPTTATDQAADETGFSSQSSQLNSGLLPIESTADSIPADPDAILESEPQASETESGAHAGPNSKRSGSDLSTDETGFEHDTAGGTTGEAREPRRNSVADSNLNENKNDSQDKSAEHSARFQTPRSQAIERIKKEIADRQQHAVKPHQDRHAEQHLVPPPPPVATIVPQQKVVTPERQALLLINSGSYAQAEQQLKQLVAGNADNFSARYLLAVALVFRRKYDEAKSNYRHVIENSSDKKLVELAEAGLSKLGQ